MKRHIRRHLARSQGTEDLAANDVVTVLLQESGRQDR